MRWKDFPIKINQVQIKRPFQQRFSIFFVETVSF